jgi:hypothetical protein
MLVEEFLSWCPSINNVTSVGHSVSFQFINEEFF